MMSDYVQISLVGSPYNWQNLPTPKLDSGSIEIITNVDGGRNALGDFIGQTVGNDKIKLNLSFPPLTDEEFRTLLSFFNREQGGQFVVWVKYYDPRYGTKQIKQMYVGNRSGDPFRVSSTTAGVPSHWLNVKADLIEV